MQVHIIPFRIDHDGLQSLKGIAGSDRDLLSCPLPPGVIFPAQIQVAVGDASTDDFEYNGEGCTTPGGSSGGGEGSPGEAATPDDGLGD